MYIRILIISMLLATACTPNPVRNAIPSQAPTEVMEEASQAAATSSPAAEEEPSEAAATSSPVPEKGTATSLPVGGDGLQKKFTQIAVDDLAAQLNLGTEEIRVHSTESIVWPDAALGCPMPNKVYAKGRVSGFRIRLEVNGKVYDYHTDSTGKIVLCLEPEVNPSEPGLR